MTVFAGSSDPLHRAVLSFTAKDRPYVVGDPGYEAGARAAEFIGAPVMRVPLVPGSFKHDVKAMVAAAPTAGLFYICNPNNPTGTITPKEDIEWLVENKPAGSVVLIDEAYIHLSTATMSSYMVAADKDVMILRTFSKLYGMAGLRAGAAIAKPELLAKCRGERRQELHRVCDHAHVCELENGCIRVGVDREDQVGALDSNAVLNRP